MVCLKIPSIDTLRLLLFKNLVFGVTSLGSGLWGQVSHLNVFEISLIFKDALLLREGKSELMKFDGFLIVNHFS
jgi:hypothetical protein